MPKINQREQCVLCGNVFKTLCSENKEEIQELRDFVSAPIPEKRLLEIRIHKILLHPESDLNYALCSFCCDDIIVDILSKIATRQRKVLFRNFDSLRKELKHDMG